MIADGVALLAHGSHTLDVFRRHSFKGEIKEEYSSLCQGTYPVEGSLFGHNFQEKIKEVNESLRVARSTRRFQPYKPNMWRFPFLGQRQGWKRRGGGNGNAQTNTMASQNRSSWGQQRKAFPRKR
ncbi:hypothetical protein PoB_004527900 [Plakobranchus ocellatus]|uniref:Uncharacterized protein n=1 Tax=Plakobranchus ocellatus TaxID=259542 RepID=A0AAV4BIR5_9GAST|nr:hypothetical protein PoB_004527900 [Plakobranchus ocellatus]